MRANKIGRKQILNFGGHMKMKEFIMSLLRLITLALGGNSIEKVDRYSIVINKMVSAINAGDYKLIQQDFGEEMLKAFPLEKSKPFFQKLISDYGQIKSLDSARLTPPSQAIFPAHFERNVFDIKIVLNDQDKIIGLWILPHLLEKNSVSLNLPFEGKWLTCWGGNTIELNQHHEIPCQKYAFDFLITDDSGKTFSGEGKKCEDYYAFGKPVLSPADGIVVDVITGVRDNVPPSMNPYSALGNSVTIQHDKYEFSVIAHFKDGSILVKAGDKVKKGQIIGACGNSGNSSEPHIHYNLQNTSIVQDGTGIQCFFDNILLWKHDKNEARAKCSPIKGDIISQKE